MCRWSKAAEQTRLLRQQHAVAEDVARHVADADAGEGARLDVAAELAEVALHRLPGALGGDPHLLVVVARRAAGGEGVAEPEAVVARHAVGDVGEGRGALVGGHHEIGVVAVAAHHVGRVHHLAVDDVVGQVEQAADERLVALDPLGELRLAAAAGGRPLDHEAALGAHRHDDGVLHHLRLDQAEDLGAEVLAAVRPADAAARHHATAQVDPLHARRVDEDLELRLGVGQLADALAVELDRDVLLGRPSAPFWKKLVRSVSFTTVRKPRRMWSSSRLFTVSSLLRISPSTAAARERKSSRWPGSNSVQKRRTSSCASSPLSTTVCAMYFWL
jgi:hypothetical protein